MEKRWNFLKAITIILLFVLSSIPMVNAESVEWDVTLNFSEPISGYMDYVVFGEATDANDGLPIDEHDQMKPPSLYLRAWLDDDFQMPYDKLLEDYRRYPDTEKIWDLYVEWESTPKNITISWDNNEFIDCEYDSIILMRYGSSNEILKFIDMRSEDHYAYMPRFYNGICFDYFQISCKKTSNGDPGGGDPSSPPNGDLPLGENHPPIANASASEIFGFVNAPLNFNGSLSTDADGYITSWIWDFGDNTTGDGETINHTYTNSGIYTATLTVTDNESATDTDTFIVQIATGNNAPTKPQVNGITEGHQNTEYTYTAVSTDLDDDTICYFFSWGDDITTVSEFLPSGTSCSMDHEWSSAGEYEIEVYAYDNKTYSEPTQLTVLIDIVYVDDIGYLIDDDGDGIYDSFYNNATGETITVEEQADGTYLIDSDGDGEWDYIFDYDLKDLAEYQITGDISELFAYCAAIGIIILIFIILILLWRRKKKK